MVTGLEVPEKDFRGGDAPASLKLHNAEVVHRDVPRLFPGWHRSGLIEALYLPRPKT